MTFGFPEALLGLLAIPVLLWLLAARRPRVEWPSTLAWPREAALPAAHRRGRPRSWLVVAAIAALVTGLARPRIEAAAEARRIGVVLDRSASMDARDDRGASRLDRAKTWLGARLATLADADRVRLWLTPADDIEAEEDLAPRLAAERIESLAPVAAPDELAGTLSRVLAARAAGTVDALWVAADYLPSGIDADVLEEAGGALLQAGEPGLNDGIVHAEVTERPDGTLRLQALVVRRSAEGPRDVELLVDDRPAKRARIGSGAQEIVSFDLLPEEQPAAGATRLRLLLAGSDALAADDEFVIVKLPPQRIRVAIEGAASEPLERALAADSAVRVEQAGAHDVTFSVSAGPSDPAIPWVGFRAPGTPGLELGPPVDVFDLRIAAIAAHFRGLRLEGVSIANAREVRGGTPEVVASTPGGAVCVAARHGNALLVGFLPEDGDFRDHPAFPLLVRNALRALAGNGRDAGWRAFRAGEEIRVSARGAPVGQVITPRGTASEIEAPDGVIRLRIWEPGVACLTVSEETWLFAVNLGSRAETELAGDHPESGASLGPPGGLESRPRSETRSRVIDLRPLLYVAAIVLLAAGWWERGAHREARGHRAGRPGTAPDRAFE